MLGTAQRPKPWNRRGKWLLCWKTRRWLRNGPVVSRISNFSATKLKLGDWFITKPKGEKINEPNVQEYHLKSQNNTVKMTIEKTPRTPGRTVEHSFDYDNMADTYDGTKTSWVDNLTKFLSPFLNMSKVESAPGQVIDEFKNFLLIKPPPKKEIN